MKKFIFKTVVFATVPLVLFFTSFFLADGYTDPYYLKFTSPPQENLILGTSRAAQALQPSVFETELGIKIYNYSFTVSQSPFGSVYLNSAKQKMIKSGKGVFIVTVDPWSLSSFGEASLDTNQLRERHLCVATTKQVSENPNFEYIFNNLRGRFINILVPPAKNVFLHDDGWLEVSRIPMDSIAVASRTTAKIKSYREQTLPIAKLSDYRLRYFVKTVRFLKESGQVYIVRLPVSEEMMELENILAPDFDQKISEVITMSDGYLDMTPDNKKFQYTDGNHLHKDSGALVSREIAEWIKKEWADEVDN